MNRPVSFLAGFFTLLFAGSILNAQEIITPVAGNPAAEAYHKASRKALKSSSADSLELPFFEDFSASYIEPDPSLWIDADAFVNNHYCIDPVTNGVATLDAIDYRGSIYAGSTLDPVSFVADHLTSAPFKLNLLPADSLYLSFLYQPGGLGDLPEEQDSLLVDFYSPADSVWMNVWGIPGSDLHPFKSVMIPITEDRYLSDGFRFRFRNRASLPKSNDFEDKRANVDHWHVDYIRLDRSRFAADTILRDVAFNTPIQSVLIDLTSLPWSHLADARDIVFDQKVKVRYRNNDSISRNLTRSLVLEEPLYGESFTPEQPTAQDLPAHKDTLVEFDYFYPLNVNRGNSAIIRIKASLRTDDIDPKVNDTVFYDQVFSDYYAYDDGTPEAGYGLRGQGTKQSSVAVKYFAYKADEIGGLDISFNQLRDSINLDYYFKLVVWNDNGGVPGTIIFEDEDDLTPDYSTHYPGFRRYYFSEPVHVDGPFYVGWRQYNEYMLNVGLDKNNRPSPHVIFYNYQGKWEESYAPGVILLRPFLYDETTGVSESDITPESLHIYPNPATDHLFITLPVGISVAGLQADLFDASGRLAQQKVIRDGFLDVSGLPGGLYFLKLSSPGRIFHAKVLINN
ncbi:MAG: T9SS type A sorting domain-containing protein [Bacteroidales bacterium]